MVWKVALREAHYIVLYYLHSTGILQCMQMPEISFDDKNPSW